MTINQAAIDRKNNLNIIRLVASLMVVYMHSFAVSIGDQSKDVFDILTNHKDLAGGIAVYIFFIISGFLICRSFDRSSSVKSYAKARFLRIWPLLFIVVIVCDFVIGPIMSEYKVHDYFAYGGNLQFLLNIFFISGTNVLPGVFHTHYFTSVNGSLWTLMYEVIWYILVAVLSPLWKRYKLTGPVLYVMLAGLYIANVFYGSVFNFIFLPDGFVANFAKLGLFFAMGMTYYLFENQIVLCGKSALIALAGLIVGIVYADFVITFSIFGAYLIFYVAFQKRFVASWYDKVGDLSYGIYIMSFPIQQILVDVFGKKQEWGGNLAMNPYVNMGLTLLIILPLSWASWHFIEQPCLKLKNRP